MLLIDLWQQRFLTLWLNRLLFLVGEAGVGKTEIAKALALALDLSLIRSQCYEGLDPATAVYDCNFPAQMVATRTEAAPSGAVREALQAKLFCDY